MKSLLDYSGKLFIFGEKIMLEKSKKERMQVHIDVHNVFISFSLDRLNDIQKEIVALEKKRSITPIIFRLKVNMKLKKLREKLEIEKMIYTEMKKQYRK